MSKAVLILAGTAEAIKLADKLHHDYPSWRIISSLAGRTKNPRLPKGETRIGGFGGVDGLVDFISKNKIEMIYDATHPYATNISRNAVIATTKSNIDYVKIERDPWEKTSSDIWTNVNTIEDAAEALPKNATVFLALGRQYINAFSNRSDCHFIARMVDQVEDIPLTSFEIITGLPNQTEQEEGELFAEHNITHLVTRNSGGQKSYAKIIAARHAKISVIMIKRPSD